MYRAILVAVSIALASGSAYADCKKRDIRGTYRMYASDITGMDQSAVCEFKVSRNGRVGNTVRCEGAQKFFTARLTLSKKCVIRGTVEADFGTGNVTGNLDGTLMTGFFVDQNSGPRTMFIGIRN